MTTSELKDRFLLQNMMLGIIKRNFEHITRNCFVTLYKSLVRSHLENLQIVCGTQKEKSTLIN